MKFKCDYCWDEFDHEPIEVERKLMYSVTMLYFCSEKCFDFYKEEYPKGGIISYERKGEK